MMGELKTPDGRAATADTTRTGIPTEAMLCPVCDGAMANMRCTWLLRCRTCGFRRSTLAMAIGDDRTAGAIDEDLRAAGLERLRRNNFERLLDRLCRQIEPHGANLLDIGCAHGWFLEAAARRGFRVAGVQNPPPRASPTPPSRPTPSPPAVPRSTCVALRVAPSGASRRCASRPPSFPH